jgi:DNA-binding beta-propeller fold protein YncE
VYITNDEDTSVSVIDGAGCNGSRTSGCGRPPEQLATDDYPGRIAVDSTTGTAYVSGGRGTVSVIPLSRARVGDQR